MDEVWNKYPDLTHLLKVGSRMFLPAFEKEAAMYAQSLGIDVKKINRPKSKKASNGS